MDYKKLDLIANEIRQDVIKMLVTAKSGHSAGSLGMADVFTALYFGGVVQYDSKNPNWEKRDRVVLSAGHICPVFYATLAHAGYFPHSELASLRRLNSRLQGHPHNLSLPGLENSSGPLGQGISQACGMAYAALKIKNETWRVYCVMSDGEHQEGQVWEALMFAGKNNLRNLTVLLDRNNIQIDGETENIMPLEPLVEKYKAFGWTVLEVDGHSIRSVVDACHHAESIAENPTVIICHTIPGKGIDFMENNYLWHGNPPDKQQANLALKELRTLGGRILSEHE